MYQEELSLVGYTEKWLQSGILSPERLLSEVEEVQFADVEPHPEHYRVATLYDFLSSRAALTDQEIDDYLQLTYEDEDKTMAFSAVLTLIKCRALSDVQFELLPTHFVVKLFKTSRIYLRQTLLRAIDREGLVPSVVERCLEEGDNVVHRRLLTFELERQTLEVLAIKGTNKAIRNIAKTRLKQRKYSR